MGDVVCHLALRVVVEPNDLPPLVVEAVLELNDETGYVASFVAITPDRSSAYIVTPSYSFVRTKPSSSSSANTSSAIRFGPVGVGGLEGAGDAALLRSIVVEAAARGAGVGTAICEALEARAVADGATTLFLLTESAAGFFADRGYVEIDRDATPDAIRRTAQFTDLCSTSATCMRKSL